LATIVVGVEAAAVIEVVVVGAEAADHNRLVTTAVGVEAAGHDRLVTIAGVVGLEAVGLVE
jgi:hypothetical protein